MSSQFGKHDLSEIENPHQTALILLSHVLGKPQTWVIAHPEAHLTPQQEQLLSQLLSRLKNGEPLPYLIGRQEFYELDFIVSPDVLIPRPETELLVDKALEWLRAHPQAGKALDIGTGSGCIPISLLMRHVDLKALGVDISEAALSVCAKNRAVYQLETRLDLRQSDLFEKVSEKFDLITANLPYIPSKKLAGLTELRFEPSPALDGGEDGLEVIRRMLEESAAFIKKPGLILLEIESSLGTKTLELSKNAFPDASLQLYQDLAGLDRLVSVEIN